MNIKKRIAKLEEKVEKHQQELRKLYAENDPFEICNKIVSNKDFKDATNLVVEYEAECFTATGNDEVSTVKVFDGEILIEEYVAVVDTEDTWLGETIQDLDREGPLFRLMKKHGLKFAIDFKTLKVTSI